MFELEKKGYWHQLFDYAPNLLSFTEKCGCDISTSFLTWCDEKKISMDWLLHMHLLHWLQQKFQLEEAMIKELMFASVTRWLLSGFDHVSAKGAMLATPSLPHLGVGVWKSTQPQVNGKIVVVRLPEGLFPTMDSYAFSAAQGVWKSLEWRQIIQA